MSKHQKLKRRKQLAIQEQNKRSFTTSEYDNLFFGGMGGDYLSGSFGYIATGNTGFGVFDFRVPAMVLRYVVNDPVIYGFIRSIKTTIFKRPWKVTGGKIKANKYTQTLKDLNWDKVAEDLVDAWLGAAGGNALVVIEKKKTVTIGDMNYFDTGIRVEPFLAEGRPRVKVYGDYNRRMTTKFDIINFQGTIIQSIEADKCLHTGLARPDNDFRFFTGPAIVAAKAANLKYQALTASETVFTNGLNFNKVISPDFSSGQEPAILEKQMRAWEQFSNLIQETSGLRNRNKDLISKTPLKIDKIGVNNTDMQTIALKQECDKEMQAAYGVALSNLGFTESANYSTSEQNRENINELNTDYIKTRLEKVAVALLELYHDDYDEEANPVKMGYDPSAEDLQMRTQNQAVFTNFITAEQALPGMFDIDDSILASLGLKRKEQTQQASDIETAIEDTATQLDQSIDDEGKRFFRKALEVPDPIVFENSKNANRVKKQLKDALTKQIYAAASK